MVINDDFNGDEHSIIASTRTIFSAPATPWCGTGRTSAVQEDPARTVEAPGPVTQSQPMTQ